MTKGLEGKLNATDYFLTFLIFVTNFLLFLFDRQPGNQFVIYYITFVSKSQLVIFSDATSETMRKHSKIEVGFTELPVELSSRFDIINETRFISLLLFYVSIKS